MDKQQLRVRLEQLHAEFEQVDVFDDNERGRLLKSVG